MSRRLKRFRKQPYFVDEPLDPSHVEFIIPPTSMSSLLQIAWLEGYLAPQPVNITDEKLVKMIAEATYWSVSLGLTESLKKMSYSETRNFHPIEEMMDHTPRSLLLAEVSKKLTIPVMSHEVSHALQQVAWVVYIKEHSYQEMLVEEAEYDRIHHDDTKIGEFVDNIQHVDN